MATAAIRMGIDITMHTILAMLDARGVLFRASDVITERSFVLQMLSRSALSCFRCYHGALFRASDVITECSFVLQMLSRSAPDVITECSFVLHCFRCYHGALFRASLLQMLSWSALSCFRCYHGALQMLSRSAPDGITERSRCYHGALQMLSRSALSGFRCYHGSGIRS